jgi:energy-coupling factor transport system permease protein
VPAGLLSRRDATAKLIAAAVLTAALLLTLDPATSIAAIVLEVAIAPLAGLGPLDLARRGWPLLVSAAGVLVFGYLFGEGGIAYALRLIAVGLPGMLAFVTIDATDLADSLMAHLRLSPRFAIGALAAFRLMPLLGEEWRQLSLARRARGLDAGWNPVARLRLFASTTFALLVGAIRRGIRLATAMEARGFDSGATRTSARTTHFDTLDILVVVGGVVLAVACLAAGRLW